MGRSDQFDFRPIGFELVDVTICFWVQAGLLRSRRLTNRCNGNLTRGLRLATPSLSPASSSADLKR